MRKLVLSALCFAGLAFAASGPASANAAAGAMAVKPPLVTKGQVEEVRWRRRHRWHRRHFFIGAPYLAWGYYRPRYYYGGYPNYYYGGYYPRRHHWRHRHWRHRHHHHRHWRHRHWRRW